MTRAALYARVSTAAQDHALQLDELRTVAHQRGYSFNEYIDTASGSGRHLPERSRLLADATAGRLDVIVVWRFDRFARSTRDLLDALDNFRRWGVEFISLRDAVDTSTPTGKLVFTIVAAIAEFERELIRERVRSGLAAARRRGKHIGRPARSVDLDRAAALLAAGTGVKETARKLGVSPRTLRRHLSGGRNPASNAVTEVVEIPSERATNAEGGKT